MSRFGPLWLHNGHEVVGTPGAPGKVSMKKSLRTPKCPAEQDLPGATLEPAGQAAALNETDSNSAVPEVVFGGAMTESPASRRARSKPGHGRDGWTS